jgi:hypothetical protein
VARALRAEPGKIRELDGLLREHGEAVEASIQAAYHISLGGLFDGTLSPRRLIVLIKHLPASSPLAIALHGDAAHWGVNEYLLASAIEVLMGANWQRGGGKGPKPKPFPRPDPRAEKRKREYVARLKRLGLIPAGSDPR